MSLKNSLSQARLNIFINSLKWQFLGRQFTIPGHRIRGSLALKISSKRYVCQSKCDFLVAPKVTFGIPADANLTGYRNSSQGRFGILLGKPSSRLESSG